MLNVAIIGCGDMGNKHAEQWMNRADVRVSVVCDTDAKRSSDLAKICEAVAHTDWREALTHTGLNHDGLDIVSVCTPAQFHRDITVAAANSGIHVLCEKPMALTLAESDEMISAAKSNSVQLAICHQYRGLSRYRTIKQLIDDGALGTPLFIRFLEMREVRPKLAMHTESLSGGPVHDMTGHLFDLARYFTECEALSVSAVGGVFGHGKDRLAQVSDLGIDTADIQVRMQNGHCVNVAINWGLPEGTPSYSHETIYGPNGLVYTQNNQQPDLNLGEISDTTVVVLKDGSGTRAIECDADDDGPGICVTDFLNSIRTGEAGVFNADAGQEALKIILASRASIDTGEPVHL